MPAKKIDVVRVSNRHDVLQVESNFKFLTCAGDLLLGARRNRSSQSQVKNANPTVVSGKRKPEHRAI